MKNYMMILTGMLLLVSGVLVQAYPDYVTADYSLAGDSDPEVRSLVQQGAEQVAYEPRQARKFLVKALERVSRGAAIDEYDYLWTQYGLMKATMEAGSAEYGPGTRDEYMRVARHLLAFMDREVNTGEAVFTEIGAFRMEVYRAASNGLAWGMMEDGKPLQQALDIIERGLAYARGPEDYYMYDTQVRILLKMGRKKDAWRIADQVLKEDEDFGDFQDIRRNPEFRAWLNGN